MNIQQLCRALGITNSSVQQKAAEFYRRSGLRSNGVGIGKAELCRSAACVGIASERAGEPFDKARAIALSGSNAKTYQLAVSTISNLLQLKSINTSKSLAVRFGCERLEPLCDRILQRYKTRFLERLSSGSGRASTSADFSHPKFLAAAFLHSCRALKVRIAKEQVLDVLNVSSAELLPVYNDMGLLCKLIEPAKPVTGKRKRDDVDTTPAASTSSHPPTDDGDDSDLEGDEVAEEWADDPSIRKSAKRQKRESFEQSKEQALAQPSPKVDGKRMRQSTLPFASKTSSTSTSTTSSTSTSSSETDDSKSIAE